MESDTEVHIHWKGAAELILASCRSWLSPDGSVQPMSSVKHSEFKKLIDDMAMSSLRCIAFAYCPWEPKMVTTKSLDKWKLPKNDLTLIGMVGIKVAYSEPSSIYTSHQYYLFKKIPSVDHSLGD